MVSDFEDLTLKAGQADKHVTQVSRMIYTVSDNASIGSLSILADVEVFKNKFPMPHLEGKTVEPILQ